MSCRVPASTVLAALTCVQGNICDLEEDEGKVSLDVSNTCLKPEAITEAVVLETSSADDAKSCCRCSSEMGKVFIHSGRLGFYAVCGK